MKVPAGSLFLNLGVLQRKTLVRFELDHDKTIVFGVSDQVIHKQGCTAAEDGYRPKIAYLGNRRTVLYIIIRGGKTKALIS